MKLFWLLLLTLAQSTSGVAQTPVDRFVRQLVQADFKAVRQAKDSLLTYQRAAIPPLLTLLRDTSFVKLENTADLIYPGATTFYGHGGVVCYDIDWVCVRAAWVLEQLTFQDFGYQDRDITEQKLLALSQKEYQPAARKGFQPLDVAPKTPKGRLTRYRAVLADSVVRWWQMQQPEWTKYQALKAALASSNEARQAAAIHYLRFEKNTCAGLTTAVYEVELKPLLLRIQQSASRAAKQASYLLDEATSYGIAPESR